MLGRWLILCGGVPPWVGVDDHAGTGQVQSGVAGLQGNQEGRRIVRIELVDEFETLLLGRGAGDGVVAQALRVETFGDQIKEAGELGEDQRFLPSFTQVSTSSVMAASLAD